MSKLPVIFSTLMLVFLLPYESARIFTTENPPLLEQHLLDLVGLESSPGEIVKKSRVEKRSAPIYLMDIYKNTVDKVPGFEYNDTAVDLTSYDFARINESDIIMSFVAQQANKRGGKPELLRRMWFDVSRNNRNQQLISAELRLFRDCSRVRKPSNRRAFLVSVFRVSFINKKRKFLPVNSVVVRENFNGWFSVNVTDCFRLWMDNPEKNFGIKVVAKPLGGFPSGKRNIRKKQRVKLEKIGIVGFDGESERFSFLVGYFRDQGEDGQFLLHRAVEKLYEEGSHGISKRAIRTRPSGCALRSVFVDFHDLRWDNIILAPPGYEARDCGGTCRYPMSDFMNGTFHSMVKEMYQDLSENRFVKSHCIPIGYESMKVLFFSNENTVVIKNYKDAIATACGCR